ncbi:MAG: hypothetical protein KatS3mg031_2205 [Chitinophagales bacterium]|nr:MAG: hypothetical protein KatS3mg031_2205 [Chitinophagales bacterium]
MQNEFDKKLRKKLEQFEAPYEAADWDRMHALLEKDRKKGLGYITLFILAAGISGLAIWSIFLSPEAPLSIRHSEPYIIKNHRHEAATPNAPLYTECSDRNDSQDAAPVNNAALLTKEIAPSSQDYNKKPTSLPLIAGNKRHPVQTVMTSGLLPQSAADGAGSRSAMALKPSLIQSTGGLHAEARMLAALPAEQIDSPEEIHAARILHLEMTKNKKFRKTKVRFATGAGMGSSASFIASGQQIYPGYKAALTQELMFVERVGLVTEEAYLFRKYDGGRYPCPEGAIGCPDSYTSSVRAFALSIHLKVNLINHPRWSWYIKGGITNVIKLEETFDYSYGSSDTIPVPPMPTLSGHNNFNSGMTTEGFFDSASSFTSSPSGQIAPPDLSISGARRYHPEFHTATGAEIWLSPVWALQIEAGYTLTRRTVGPNDYRLQTPELNGRVVYYFGK